MIKKNRYIIVILFCIIGLSCFFLLKQQENLKNKDTIAVVDDKLKPENIVDKDHVEVNNIYIKVEDAYYSKKLDKKFPKPSYIDQLVIEKNNILQSKHLYVYIPISVINNNTTEYELSINNIRLVTHNLADNQNNSHELWAIDINSKNYNKRDYFHCLLKEKEDKKIILVYVIEEKYKDENIDFLLDMNLSGVGYVFGTQGIEYTDNKFINLNNILHKGEDYD